MTELEDFNPDRSSFFTLNFDGSCRLTQYPLSFKLVLKRLGLVRIPVIAPATSIRLDEASELLGLDCVAGIWKGWLATDVLIKKLLHIRPYELNKGETEAAYERAIQVVASGLARREFWRPFADAVEAMDRVPVRRETRPVIGIVGEFYSCMNNWANNDIIKHFESLGAETRMGPTTTDYMVYFNHAYPGTHFSSGEYPAALYYYFRRFWLARWQRRIEGTLGEELAEFAIPSIRERVEQASPYVSPDIDPVVTVNIAKAEGYAAQGCAGIANLIVLNCVFGSLATAIYKKVQREHNQIPMLTMIYDGLKQTNEKTRIEAFVHQAKAYHERYGNKE